MSQEDIHLNKDNIDLLSNIVIQKIKNNDSDLLTLNNLIINVLEVVEFTKSSGDEKKRIAMLLIERFISYHPENYTYFKKTLKYNLDNGFISDTIDLVVKASKNEIKINIKNIVKSNKFKIFVLKCFKYCFKK